MQMTDKIVVVEIGGIQRLISRTGELKAMRGASLIVDSTINELASKARNLGGDVISKGGGQLIFTTSNEDLHAFGNNLSELNTSEIVDEIKVGISDEEYGFGESVSKAIRQLRPLQKKSTTCESIPLVNMCTKCRLDTTLWDHQKFQEILSRIDSIQDQRYNYTKVCAVCAFCELYDFVFRLAIKSKSEVIHKLAQDLFIEDTSTYKLHSSLMEQVGEFEVSYDLDLFEDEYEAGELRRNYLAFIVGDGDNFGNIKKKLKEKMEYRKVSQVFRDILEGGIKQGAKKAIETKRRAMNFRNEGWRSKGKKLMPCIPIYAGGDDMFVLVESAYLVSFLNGFKSNFDNVLENNKDSLEGIHHLGVSMGIGISNCKDPLNLIRGNAMIMESKAKNMSKSPRMTQGPKLGEIHLAFHFNRVGTFLSEQDKNVVGPMNFGQFQKLIDVARQIYTSGNLKPNDIEPYLNFSRSGYKKIYHGTLHNETLDNGQVSLGSAWIQLILKYNMSRDINKRSGKSEGLKHLFEYLFKDQENDYISKLQGLIDLGVSVSRSVGSGTTVEKLRKIMEVVFR
jgi:predicted nucleic-acid-binding Zn-ribbon protein